MKRGRPQGIVVVPSATSHVARRPEWLRWALRVALVLTLAVGGSVGDAIGGGSGETIDVLVRSDAGIPVPGAVLLLRDPMTGREERGVSGADGRTALRPGFEAPLMTLLVSARGYLPKQSAVREVAGPVVVTLTRAASLFGRVRATEGELPPGIVLHMLAVAQGAVRDWANLGFRSAPVATVSRSGGFDFEAVPTSVALRLLILTPGWILDRPIEKLAVGESRDLGELRVVPTRTLAVRCVGPSGEPVEGARVAVDGTPVSTRRAPWDHTGRPVAVGDRCDEIPASATNRAGWVSLGVPGSRGSITVDSDPHEVWRGAFDLASARELTVRLKRAAGVLTGRVVAADGAYAEPSRTLLHVIDAAGAIAGEGYAARTGAFRVLAVRGTGPWKVMLGGPRWIGLEPTVVQDLAPAITIRVPARIEANLRVVGRGGVALSSVRIVVTRLAGDEVGETEVLRAVMFANDDGGYRVFLPPGTYRLRIGAAGYRWTTVPRVEFSGGQSREHVAEVELTPE